jgi:LPXTG-motif cell wall-anchored protein
MAGTMKKMLIMLAALALLLLMALPAAVDLGYEEPTVSPTEEETEEPTVLPTEEESEEPVVEAEEEVAEEELAVTGADAMTIGLLGGGLLLAGGTALAATRRSKADASE